MWNLYLLLFLSSACIMTVELVAGRLVAPHLGVSLYTWTGIIGACLTGMSFGSLFGGWLADRGEPRRWLPWFLLSSSAFVWGLLLARSTVGHFAEALAQVGLSPIAGIFVLSMVLFGLPCFFLAGVSPLAYKLALGNSGRVGTTVGRLAASGIAGSIAGTYATGFWLISAFGTAAILAGVGAMLGLLGAWSMSASAVRRTVTAALALAVPWTASSALPASAAARCDAESAYYCIRVEVDDRDDILGPVKKLHLDYLIHSGLRVNLPNLLWYEYEQVVGWLMEARGQSSPRTLFLGGGGYILPHWVEREFPDANVDVVEIDPEVTRIAKKEFVPEAERIRTLTMDARLALNRMPKGQTYDVIFGDVFNDLSVPYHLTTVEFARLVKSRLAHGGMYIVNVVDQKGEGPLLSAMVRTLGEVFPHVYTLPGMRSARGRGPHVLVAAAEPIPWEDWRAHSSRPWFDVNLMTVPDTGLLLTDDYVPTDHLLLPVFADRWGPES